MAKRRCAALLSSLALVSADPSRAQSVRTERVDLPEVAQLRLIEGKITGYEGVDYLVSAEQSQILSVDMQASNAAASFNIRPQGSDEAIFIGSSRGTVADVPVPTAGGYVIQVYLERNAARRNETASYSLGVSLGAPDFADGLAGGPDYWQVTGLGSGSALNVRSGPATRYSVISKLRNGNVLQNKGCRMTGHTRWCDIRAAGSGQQGWVAGRFLVESAAPPAPSMPKGGPIGNGTGFDATGSLACALAAGQPGQPGRPPGRCLFGVVRQGPGNAGVWIALGNGRERHILFEGGIPVATNADAPLEVERDADVSVVRVGEERFEIPDAIVYGG